MLVVPDSSYCNRVPIPLGTIHIDMLIKLATQKELGKLNHCWKRGAVLTGAVMWWAQLVSRKLWTDQINNDVKLTKNVTIRPLETIETRWISKVPNHEKHVNVIIEPSPVDQQGNEIYTVPVYNFLKAGSKWVGIALRNLSSRAFILKRGTVVAHVTAVNEIPPALTPKIIIKASTVNVHSCVHLSAGVKIGKEHANPDAQWVHTLPTPERLDNLFEKLDLPGAQAWTDQER